jgi:methyl-accepting chemotaxis protein/NAD-dependent dihydropyrimidine dehydrogenase PreA subunit
MKISKVIEVDEKLCLNCHKCIEVCPVKYANNGSGDHVAVRDEFCIGCGECIKACPHNARKQVDDFTLAFNALKNREKVVAIVAPAIAANYPETYLNFNGWLKSLGVSAIFDVSFGAELTVKSYLNYIKENNPKAVIAQPCPAIVSYIEIYKPELLKYLSPADSPMMHTIKMIKNFYEEYRNHKILIVSPCIAKKREFEIVGLGDFNVTLTSFDEYISKSKINLHDFPLTDFDNDPAERAVLFSTPGGLMRTAQRENPNIVNVTRKIEGVHTVYNYLDELEENIRKNVAPLLVDCLNCEHGCNGGTGTSHKKSQDEIEHSIEKRNAYMQKRYKSKLFSKSEKISRYKLNKVLNKYWKNNLYTRVYVDLKNKGNDHKFKIPQKSEINSIYLNMLKEKEEDILNCGGCGYKGCEQMATAIINGLNKKENCRVYQNKYLVTSIEEMLIKVEKFAEGDLTIQLSIKNNDEIGKLFKGFNNAVENIKQLVFSVISAVDSTYNAAKQITKSANNMAQGATQQTEQIEEIAGGMEEVSKTILSTSHNASNAAENSKSANDSAKNGLLKINETRIGMEKIVNSTKEVWNLISSLSNKTDQIGNIAKVIDEIASQTNLLALNAAIEAARAGDQGRGFAVVADEVKKLAERTTKATKEIAETIYTIQSEAKSADSYMKNTVTFVEDGFQQTENLGLALNTIQEKNNLVEGMIYQVATASEEQSTASEQITTSIESINKISKEVSSGSQLIADSAEEFNALTQNLIEIVKKFKTEESKSKITSESKKEKLVLVN